MTEKVNGYVDFAGEIRTSFMRVGRVPRFWVLVDDDQLVSSRKVVIPYTRFVGYSEDGARLLNCRFGLVRSGLVTVPFDAIELGRFVTVRKPLRPDRRPYIPLETLVKP